jgi:hypothetical protein
VEQILESIQLKEKKEKNTIPLALTTTKGTELRKTKCEE